MNRCIVNKAPAEYDGVNFADPGFFDAFPVSVLQPRPNPLM